MGLTFGKFALRNRVAHAASVLLSTDLPLEAIAGEYGFGDASHLHHAFVKQYGCTPVQYREQGWHKVRR
jgi:transcriptional regulator GlxA family with amidase domain